MPARKGVFAFVTVAVLLGIAVLVVALRVHGPVRPRGDVVLVLRLPRTLPEGALPAPTLFVPSRRPSRFTTWDLLRTLDAASSDSRVHGLVLHVGSLDWGWARIGEVRDAVARFRRSGKPVYASVTGGGDREYLLASAAQRVSMPPTADLQLDGLVATATFFRGTFDKLGVTPNFAYVGRFKSAVEPYTRTGMSPDARLATEVLLDQLYATLLDGIAAGRRLSRDSVVRIVDGGPYTATEARRAGLLDTLLYDSEVDSLALRRGARRLDAENFDEYMDDLPEPLGPPRVALVCAEGEIAGGRSRDLPGQDLVLGSETVVAALRQARTRESVKAIVLRIDSPGGEAQASDEIWREVQRCRAVKPVIVSMSDLGASGGYYFAVAADSVLAWPTTLTGSIGIFGGKLNVLGLYHKLGLNVETVSRGRNAEIMSPFHDFTPEELSRFQASMRSFYEGFVARVARGRRLPAARVDSLAQGRVWTGTQAAARGLVDRTGGLEDALAIARRRAGVPADEDLAIERLPHERRSWLERTLEDLVDRDDNTSIPAMPPAVAAWLTIQSFPAGQPLAVMPFRLEIR